MRRLTGQPVAVQVELDRTASAPERHAAALQPPAPLDKKKSLASLPLFKKASEVLGAQIWHVDDDFNPAAQPRAAKDDDEANTDEGVTGHV